MTPWCLDSESTELCVSFFLMFHPQTLFKAVKNCTKITSVFIQCRFSKKATTFWQNLSVDFTKQLSTFQINQEILSNCFGLLRKFEFEIFLMIKLRHYEKATKFEKNLPPVLLKKLFYSVVSKEAGDFFKSVPDFNHTFSF